MMREALFRVFAPRDLIPEPGGFRYVEGPRHPGADPVRIQGSYQEVINKHVPFFLQNHSDGR